MAVPSAEQGRGADRLGAALAVRDGGWRLRQPASGQLRRCCPRVRPRAGRAAADGCGRGAPGVRDRVDALAQRYLGAAAEPSTQARFQAAQLAGLHLLEEHARGPVQLRAAIALAVLVPTGSTRSRDRGRTVSVVDRLSETTLATELRKDRDLCAELWPPTSPGRGRPRRSSGGGSGGGACPAPPYAWTSPPSTCGCARCGALAVSPVAGPLTAVRWHVTP